MLQEFNVVSTTALSLGIVDTESKGLAIYARAASDLDGGTITIGFRPPNTTGVIEALDATLTAGAGITVVTGAGAEVFATCSGAAADVDLLVGQFR